MKCPYCFNKNSMVVDKRNSDNDSVIRRRRKCLKCERRFTTYEKLGSIDLKVKKRDGRIVNFDREKLANGIMRACEKRNMGAKKVNSLVESIEKDILTTGESEITTEKIGNIVMKRLKKFDPVAYIRFASVYREFEDPQQFLEEIKHIKKKKNKKKQALPVKSEQKT